MKTKLLNIYLGIMLLLGATSCSDFLEVDPTDKVSDAVAWSTVDGAELVVNQFYHKIHTYGTYGEQTKAGISEGLTDVFKYGSMTFNAHMYIPNEIAYGGSVLTANYVASYFGIWDDVYLEIRRINQSIERLRTQGKLSEEDTKRIEAELKFFRAYNYFELTKRYHDVIVYDEDMTQISADKPLNSEAEAWALVKSDLEFAGQNLPQKSSRVTSGAAYALLSRAMLYAEDWATAESAALEVQKQGYGLASTYEQAIDPTIADNKEIILKYDYNAGAISHSFDNMFSPAGDKNVGMLTTGGYGTPTQEMVESFELAGKGGFPDWTPWHGETNQTPPYAELEPRFAATILYNGAIWRDRAVEPFVDGVDGWAAWKDDPNPAGKTTTGYYLKKLLNEKHDFKLGTGSTKSWVAIRYAEVLLNYAEACYRQNKTAEANAAVKAIRTRVGLPYADKAGQALFDAIRQERKVELAYEGQYYWDMRRWKLAETAFTGNRVHGLKITKNSDGSFVYQYVDCDKQDRHFPSKMYQIPMSTGEINNNPSITQYKEWR